MIGSIPTWFTASARDPRRFPAEATSPRSVVRWRRYGLAYVQAYGARNAKGDPLQTDTVMYGASLTKTVMAYTALTLMDQGKLDLDAPLADYLERPLISYGEGQAQLAKYGPYRDLAGDDRWRTVTARMALTHSTGFHNFWFIEPDKKLRIRFDPGSRYSYSGEGFSLLQSLEQGAMTRGLGSTSRS